MLNIFNIQRFSTHDGEGIRTNVFLKGCPLKCPWCSNPESRSHRPTLLYDKRLCKKFGDCIKASKGAIHFENEEIKISQTKSFEIDGLRDVCFTKALTIAGDWRSVDSIIESVEKDLPFYLQSNGGVTLTGGEPFAQSLILLDLVMALKDKDVDVAVETSLHEPWEKIEPFTPFIDTWLADIKHVDSAKFKKFTGGNANLIMDNFHKLTALDTNVIARVPVIPEFNDTFSEMKLIIDFVSSLQKIKEIHFMPYHAMGESKYDLMQIDYRYKGSRKIESKSLDQIIKYTKSKKLKYRIGG